jgi:DNA polymerase-4
MTLGQLADMPPDALKSHFGASGEGLYRRSNGIDERRISPPAEVKSVSRETTFDRDISAGPSLEATLRYLSERVGRDLRRKGRQARCITLKLRYADFTTITRSRTLPQPTDTDQTIYSTGTTLLRGALSGERQPVRLIGIGVSNLTEPAQQLRMFYSPDRRLEQLNRSIDRIRDRYGFSAIQTGRTLRLRDIFPSKDGGDYTLSTPGLSR